MVAADCSQSWIGPKVAWSFVAMADPDLMEPMFTENEPADVWLRLKAERALRIEGAIG